MLGHRRARLHLNKTAFRVLDLREGSLPLASELCKCGSPWTRRGDVLISQDSPLVSTGGETTLFSTSVTARMLVMDWQASVGYRAERWFADLGLL